MNDYDFSALLTMQQSRKEAMLCIARKLIKNAIPYIIKPYAGGFVVEFPWCSGDIACNDLTDYCTIGRVETYRFPWDNGDVTLLTPEEAVNKVINFYNEKGEDDHVGK